MRPARIPPTDRAPAAPQVPWDWAAIRSELGVRDDDCNLGRLAADRHAEGPLADATALRCLDPQGRPTELRYRDLAARTDRFARGLAGLGVARGERVFILTGRCEALFIAALGSLKQGCVVSPLFAAFGPEPLATRLSLGMADVLVTTLPLYQRKVAALRPQVPSLRHVLVVRAPGDTTPLPPGTLDYAAFLASAPAGPPGQATSAQEAALLHFTSGTTGTPKGVLHVHEAALMHFASARLALDLRPGDVYWCTADPGWVTGTSYGLLAPLMHGATCIVDEAEFDAERWYRTLEEQAVQVWYTAPTAIRMLMKAGPELAGRHRFPALRFMASVGEALNPQAVWWGQDVLGRPIHDNWWQTETGAIMIANTATMAIKPGSMGRPLPGIEAAIVQRGPGGVQVRQEPGIEGELALRSGWPSMFRAYLGQAERYRACFDRGWYLSGDLARRDADGDYWFIGRADDVIKSAGHLIGPFEVESALLEHPAVAEAGVIGKPDPIIGEMVKAFVALKPGIEPDETLRRALLGHARARLGAAVAPKEIAFVGHLPRTRSGKIMRRLLKAREMGLPEGDTSTLEPPA